MNAIHMLVPLATVIGAIIGPAASTLGCLAAEPNDQNTIAASVLAEVTIERDEYAVPRITAESFGDAIYALGRVHAQDRYFQMDGMRRLAAGELAELFGRSMLQNDRDYRPYRFRQIAQQVVANLGDDELAILQRYTDGVNEALDDMEQKPFEYAALNLEVTPWRPEDTVLNMLIMFDMLHMEAGFERQATLWRDAFPMPLVDFLLTDVGMFDTLADGSRSRHSPHEIPGPDVFDLRDHAHVFDSSEPETLIAQDVTPALPNVWGSNNWAVDASRSANGEAAILVNDPHLGLTLPGAWHRASLHWNGGEWHGMTLPGAPAIIIGSNGHLAWGVTNMMGDFQDLILIETDPDDSDQYLTPDGPEPFGEVVEEIKIRGEGVERLTLRTTRWGVVRDHRLLDRPVVLKWTALHPEMVNLDLMRMAHARTLEEGIEIMGDWYGPAQNVLIASRDGRIGWVTSGYLPKRVGFCGRFAESWANPGIGWDGPIDEDDRPMIIDPPNGVLLTANNRTMPAEQARTIGGIWADASRARRIAELLDRQENFSEEDLYAMQLDSRVKLMDFYAELTEKTLANITPENDEIAEVIATALEEVRAWDGHAEPDSRGLPLLGAIRTALLRQATRPIVEVGRTKHRALVYSWLNRETPVRQLLIERPEHLLGPHWSSWEELIETTILQTVESAAEAETLRQTWGESNTLIAQHPIASMMPGGGDRLNLPSVPHPGHTSAIRVAGQSFGVSCRLVVAPGREEAGFANLPAGQSGDPRSPHYRDHFESWRDGRPMPLLPGRAVSNEFLRPHE
ncbi:MAG: penicillin acylase family protein [Phycisphaerales bacterium]|nr:MAG: penicillin acylase family protein [Phycisphaerales bacterium]